MGAPLQKDAAGARYSFFHGVRAGWGAVMIRFPKILCGLLLLALLAAGLSRAASPEAVAEAVEQVYAPGNYQTELPKEAPPEAPREPWELPDAVREIVAIVFWTLVVVGVLLLLFYLANALPSLQAALGRRKQGSDGGGGGAVATDADRERLDVALAEADRLAGQGAFGAALHLLLLYCLNELRRRFGLSLPPAFTSREIVTAAGLPEIRRDGLKVIVSAVEVSHFGGRPVDADTYRLCRARCEDVVLGGAAS